MAGQDDWGMNPDALHQAGGSLGDLESQATSAKTAFLNALESGGGAVHHAGLTSAIEAYTSTWQTSANNLPTSVRNAGTQVQQTAVTGVESDGQAEVDVTAGPYARTDMAPTPMLTRPITAQ